jgi:hypothetical protein
MSDYHVMSQSADLKTVQIVFHIPVPDVVNEAAINYRAALVQQLTLDGAVIVSAYPNTIGAEITLLEAGELLEVVKSVRFSRLGLTPAEKAAELDVEYAAVQASLLTDKQAELEWWGADRDVA